MFAIFVLCLVGIVAAQRPVPCTTPRQWEGRVFDVNEQSQFGLQGRLSYDAVNQRERIVDEVEAGTETDFYDVIALFELKVEFVFNFRARNCSRRPLTRPWRNFSINPNDTSLGEAYIASANDPNAGLLVTIWSGNFTTPGNDSVGFVTSFTLNGCVPVSRTEFSRNYGVSHLSYFDVTLGIPDPYVFIPRRECLTDAEWANRFTLFGTPSMKY